MTYDLNELPKSLEPYAISVAKEVVARRPVILMGPPGFGKTMIARRMTGVLPAMTDKEIAVVTESYHQNGMFGLDEKVEQRPFRAPHHTISAAAMTGTSAMPERKNARGVVIANARSARPGEVELARGGILLLDEFNEFRREAFTAAARGASEFGYSIIATANPCPCGWRGYTERECTCPTSSRDRWEGHMVNYANLLSSRVLVVKLPPTTLANLRSEERCKSTEEIRTLADS